MYRDKNCENSRKNYLGGGSITNCSLTAEQQKCIDGANVLGKFLYMLCYMSVESLMGDPTKPLMEDGKYPAVSHFVTTKTQNEIRYSSNSLPRALDYIPSDYDTYPPPTVTKDLVVADTEENPIYDELEGKYEKEYMGSNLWCVNEKVSDRQFQERVFDALESVFFAPKIVMKTKDKVYNILE